MEDIIQDIVTALHACAPNAPDAKLLEGILRAHNRALPAGAAPASKKKLLPYYLNVKNTQHERWASWGIDASTEARLVALLQMKPRRTASGVATITVLTKPWRCSSACLYCPNDARMPKSYLADEPACQRAERTCFDPYLQVAARLRALTQMGHVTDKVELIVLGGTWSDYPAPYQIWFIHELFRALNDAGVDAPERQELYRQLGIGSQPEDLATRVAPYQQRIQNGTLTYNQAVAALYEHDDAWSAAAAWQVATMDQLQNQQSINETARHRVVGLVVETRPDLVDAPSLTLLRHLGCTKVQIGVQSVDDRILQMNDRGIQADRIAQAFSLLRVFGFKIHAHFMVNLYGSTPESDKRDYRDFVTNAAFQPDEVKLYPCALVAGTRLCAHFEDGSWIPYTEDQLIDVLASDTLATPPFVRISRMIRDISAHDILAGNKKVNLRQMVEGQLQRQGATIPEIRAREIAMHDADVPHVHLDEVRYETAATSERFLQWITPEGRIAGFLRLSLPHQSYVEAHQDELPVHLGEAMIREVHVYGRVAGLHKTGAGAQHLGLGRHLIDRACAIARDAGYTSLNVISSVGTREYYRHLGFSDGEFYQSKPLQGE